MKIETDLDWVAFEIADYHHTKIMDYLQKRNQHFLTEQKQVVASSLFAE